MESGVRGAGVAEKSGKKYYHVWLFQTQLAQNGSLNFKLNLSISRNTPLQELFRACLPPSLSQRKDLDFLEHSYKGRVLKHNVHEVIAQ
jgi:hypothetical protein